MPYLSEDIYNLKGDFLYAKKGTQVEVLHDGETAVVVRDDEGNRFPMESKYLTDINQVKEEVKEPEKPVEKQEKKEVKAKAKTRTVAPAQPGLFS
jgi:hypothetical protein